MTDSHPEEAHNYETMLALGRVLSEALRDTPLRPDLRVRSNLLAAEDEQPECYLVLEANNSRQWVTPDAMAVLADWKIPVEPIKRDHWANGLYAEFRVDIPDDVSNAYEMAVEKLEGPPKPLTDQDNPHPWTHDNIMASYRVHTEQADA